MMLFPSLPESPELKAKIRDYCTLTLSELANHRALEHTEAVWSAVGNQVSKARLLAMQTRLIATAEAYGYPNQIPGKGHETARKVDTEWAIALHQELQDVSPHHSFRADMWNFISMVLAPDLVLWRWGSKSSEERWVGHGQGTRHCFGRLWKRAFILFNADSEDPYILLRSLGEDELVQIFERPSLAGHAALARDIVNVHTSMHSVLTSMNRSDLMRNVMKVLMRKGAFLEIGSLSNSQRMDLVLRSAQQVIEAGLQAHSTEVSA